MYQHLTRWPLYCVKCRCPKCSCLIRNVLPNYSIPSLLDIFARENGEQRPEQGDWRFQEDVALETFFSHVARPVYVVDE